MIYCPTFSFFSISVLMLSDQSINFNNFFTSIYSIFTLLSAIKTYQLLIAAFYRKKGKEVAGPVLCFYQVSSIKHFSSTYDYQQKG